MHAEILDPIRDPRWMRLVERNASASIFQHREWLALLERRYRYSFVAPCAIDADGEAVGGIPLARVESRLTGRRLVAVPFSDLCPVLAQDASVRRTVADTLVEERRRTGLDVEIRATVDGFPAGHVVARFVHHLLTLDRDSERIEKRMRSQVRRGAARAVREGVSIEQRTDAAALDAFYRLHLRTRRRQGSPTQPKRFIDGLVKLFDLGLGFVLLARQAGRPTAAAVFLMLHGTLTYKYGASDERYLAARPNNLLFLEAIRWGCQNGQRRLDFGRTDLGNTGLRRFKSAWGADECALAYTYLADRPPSEGGGYSRRVLKTCIRHAPQTLGRVVGATLYRHAG
jgi:CelD/BcsL family acetyltransferase involved in cellulose biosynthesis